MSYEPGSKIKLQRPGWFGGIGQKLTIGILMLMLLPVAATCREKSPSVTHTLPQLEYILFARYEVFWCDPDLWPIARPGQEEKSALEQFPAIRANEAEFAAIRQYLNLDDKSDYTPEEKLLIYRQHKKLTFAIEISPAGEGYSFILRVGEGQGERIEGAISVFGEITVRKREPSFNTCPICLVRGVAIATPEGAVAVEQLRVGMPVWTVDSSGRRVPATVVRIAVKAAPSHFRAVRIVLDDGRTITASAGHPTADGRALGEYRVGETLDGGLVVTVEYAAGGSYTYDLLPSGATGLYWANGVLLKSTLR